MGRASPDFAHSAHSVKGASLLLNRCVGVGVGVLVVLLRVNASGIDTGRTANVRVSEHVSISNLRVKKERKNDIMQEKEDG